ICANGESCIKQFWATAKAKTVNREVQIQALVDGKKVIVTETSVRRALQLKDVEGTECLPNATIFEQLTLMGYENLTQKLTFYKAFFSPQWKFLIHTILQCLSAKTTAWNEFSSTMASAIICLATNQKFNFSKYIFDNMVKNLEGGVKFLMYPRFVQVFLDKQVEGMTKHKEIYVTPSHTKKVFANMKREGKGFSRRPQKKQLRRKQRKDTEISQSSGSTKPITDEAANEEHVPTHSSNPLRSEVTLVNETQGRNDDNLMFDIEVLYEQEADVEKVIKAAKPKAVTTAATTTTTAVTRPKARGVVKAFDKTMRWIDSYVSMDSEVVKGDKEKDEGGVTRAEESSSKRVGTELEQERIKKQKMDDDQEEAEIKKHMEIVVDEEEIEVYDIPLATKPPIIIDWKIIKDRKI
ncbi:hypothetical protein Tco_1347297, partial [Tanacetum coccineum]